LFAQGIKEITKNSGTIFCEHSRCRWHPMIKSLIFAQAIEGSYGAGFWI
jgi:hypothetical protein